MQVRTLHEENLKVSVGELVGLLGQDSFCPDYVVGVATGGAKLLDYINLSCVTSCVIRAQRPSTAGKKAIKLGFFASFLPYAILDRMRVLESFLLAKNRPVEDQVVVTWQAGTDFESLAQAKSILIVDDAIDSGVTMKSVLDEVRNKSDSDAEVRIAVLTVTTDAPLLSPDYSLHQKVLLRFPWSMDYRP